MSVRFSVCAWYFHTALSSIVSAEHCYIHRIVQNCGLSQPHDLPPSSVDSTVNVPSVPVVLQLSSFAPPWWLSLYVISCHISCHGTCQESYSDWCASITLTQNSSTHLHYKNCILCAFVIPTSCHFTGPLPYHALFCTNVTFLCWFASIVVPQWDMSPMYMSNFHSTCLFLEVLQGSIYCKVAVCLSPSDEVTSI